MKDYKTTQVMKKEQIREIMYDVMRDIADYKNIINELNFEDKEVRPVISEVMRDMHELLNDGIISKNTVDEARHIMQLFLKA